MLIAATESVKLLPVHFGWVEKGILETQRPALVVGYETQSAIVVSALVNRNLIDWLAENLQIPLVFLE